MKGMLTVGKYMTTAPIAIDAASAVREAHTLMNVNGFRHLPVVRDGQPIGILSDRDLSLALSLRGIDLDSTRVEDIASFELYAVTPEAPLDVVAKTLAAKRISSALIIEKGKLVGIFTTTDALLALSDILNRLLG